ncbi:MAG: hypothetical protein NTW36_08160 [Planctomycetia bacterium]|nr:hypothetical protein [Planctomycetia bacterium]
MNIETTPVHNTLDLIDRVFLGRTALDFADPVRQTIDRVRATVGPAVSDQTAALPAAAATVAPPPVDPQAVAIQAVAMQFGDPLLSKLLESVPDQWIQIAEQIEAAQAVGCRVFAITAGQPGAGVTTVARGAFLTLQGRGRRVACVSKPPLQCRDLKAREHHADRADIVIVDAGIWFPPGPIRQRQVAQLAFGCDAVILVRRADRAAVPAQGETLTACGLRVLGEVITFEMASSPDDSVEPPDA